LALEDDNPFTRAAEALRGGAGDIPRLLETLAAADLHRLGRIAAFDITGYGRMVAEDLRRNGFATAEKRILVEARAFLPADDGAESAAVLNGPDWSAALPRFVAYIRDHGAGELAGNHFFFWTKNAALGGMSISPVRSPDPVRLADLAGYESQRSVVIANTLRFVEGKPANNLLLHGDRGTGKSATVKAVCNEFAENGLRLLEVRKNDLFDLPAILDTLAARSLPFIVFIDDLSFEAIDDSFTCLKALLEGGVEVRPPNVVIYATSNRRHLVKERIADRPSLAQAAADFSGEVRAFETMQEQFSLADRFGLSLVFTAPSQEEYLRIAGHIAFRRGLLASPEGGGAFRENALRWEKSAKKYIELYDKTRAKFGF
jgi:predicted AAA+ superfamily ATPase